MKVLLLEDSEMSIRICKKYLALMDINDVTPIKQGGYEGMHHILQSIPTGLIYDLIFVDINMPGMDGIQFVIELKKVKEYAKVPIIMITGDSDKEKVLKAFKAGARHYILKPYNQETLMEKVKLATSSV